MVKNRSFHIININSELVKKDFRTYHGTRPAQAALKAFNWLCRDNNLEHFEMTFTLEEISEHKKQYLYKGSRQKLDTPKIIKLKNGEVYNVHHHTTVHKVK